MDRRSMNLTPFLDFIARFRRPSALLECSLFDTTCICFLAEVAIPYGIVA